jgi:hypothetical protein
MLEFLRGKASDRKLRLFACACVRRAGYLAKNRRLVRALSLLERFLDGTGTDRDRGRAHQLGVQVLQSGRLDLSQQCLGAEVWEGARKTLDRQVHAFGESAAAAVGYAAGGGDPEFQTAKSAERGAQVAIVRDNFGNPFRPVSADPAWFNSTAVSLAAGIYADRAFDRLPILADALQDAGCDNADVLDHCRSDGPHVRGCWVVDLLTGRK